MSIWPPFTPAAERIAEFLANFSGDLHVTVSHVSWAGLAWLADRTADRNVSVLIGNMAHDSLKLENCKSQDCEKSFDFIRRDNVKISTYYEKDQSGVFVTKVYMKVWVIVEDNQPVAALSGSANLTDAGLNQYWGSMVTPILADRKQLWREIEMLHKEKAWDQKQVLLRVLKASQAESTHSSR